MVVAVAMAMIVVRIMVVVVVMYQGLLRRRAPCSLEPPADQACSTNVAAARRAAGMLGSHGRRLAVKAWWLTFLLAIAPAAGCAAQPRAAPLVLEQVIPLPRVEGRIDHLAVDPNGRRLFVAELGNGSVEAVDLASGKVVGRISGLREPQGLAFLPDRDELAVASGGDGSLRVYRAGDLAPLAVLALGSDADDVRLEPGGGRVVVGFGSGGLAVVDPAARRVVRVASLPAHPEGFEISNGLAYVNLPDAGAIAVADLATGRRVATWPNGWLRFNFPMALDPAGASVAVAYRLPAQVAILDRATGARRQTLGTCGDADDLFFDAKRRRLYVVCGGGSVDVFEAGGRGYGRAARVASRPGARTGLFVPQLDRLYVAARAAPGRDAAILVFRPAP